MWIDLQKAFDKVWTDGLRLKLRRCNISGNMFKWIKSYTHNRKARVVIDNNRSKKILLRHGVPQGGVLSPTLFIVFMNDLVKQIPTFVKSAMYADDLVMWSTEEYAATAQIRLQTAVNILSNWANEWCVKINRSKTFTTLFTLSTKVKPVKIMLNHTELQHIDSATYLGVTFDRRQTWKPHICNAETKARRKLALLRKLAGTQWGAAEAVLKNVYIGTIRPHLDYGSTTCSSASKTSNYTLDKVQNQALRLITGSMRSTPIKIMEEITAIQPLSKRRDMRIMIQAERYKCSPSHPMKTKIHGMTKNRIKRESFIHKTNTLSELYESSSNTVQSTYSSPPPCQNTTRSIYIRVTVPSVTRDQDDTSKKLLTLSYIDDLYPQDTWIRIYTDGSATDAIQDGGAASIIYLPDGDTIESATATGKHCTNYTAEVKALSQGAQAILYIVANHKEDVVFLTDSKSVLDALACHGEHEVRVKLSKLIESRRVVLQWIPAHCGISGNEKADELAKRGANMQQENLPITIKQKKTIIKNMFRVKTIHDDYHKLDRAGQVILLRLRTGHNRLNAHMYKKMKLVPSSMCICNIEDQTTQHILQRCPNHTNIRNQLWPDNTTLQQKLYGPLEQLRKTVSFIQQSGLSV